VFTAKVPKYHEVILTRDRQALNTQFQLVPALARTAGTGIGISTGRSVGWNGYRMQEFVRTEPLGRPHGTFYLAEENVRAGINRVEARARQAADAALQAYTHSIPGIGPLITVASWLTGTVGNENPTPERLARVAHYTPLDPQGFTELMALVNRIRTPEAYQEANRLFVLQLPKWKKGWQAASLLEQLQVQYAGFPEKLKALRPDLERWASYTEPNPTMGSHTLRVNAARATSLVAEDGTLRRVEKGDFLGDFISVGQSRVQVHWQGKLYSIPSADTVIE
jgi:hypothetical protein